MSPDPNSIVLDVDGVLLDCAGGFAKVAHLHFGLALPELNKSYDLGKRYGLTQAQADEVWEAMKHHEHGWRGFDVLPGARNAFFRLRSRNYAIHLVSAISEDLRDLRWDCLESHGMVPDSLHCVGAFDAPKEQVIQALNPIMVVEDRLSNLHDLPFVPNRVFVDHGDEQLGYVVHEDLIRVKSLSQWVDQWELSQGLPPRPLMSPISSQRP
jgi:phosphoglycolate phosphatase-like HAD superfamily hydrolase